MDMQYCDSCGEVIQGEALKQSTLGDKFICDACRSSGKAKPTKNKESSGEISLSSAMQSSNLELFSSDTIAKRRTESKAKSRLTLVDDQPEEASPLEDTKIDLKTGQSATNVGLVTTLHEQAKKEGSGSTFYVRQNSGSSASASRPANVLRIHCTHCQTKLGIRPVAQKSKMQCPRCEGVLVIDVDGSVSKPQAGSSVTKRAERPPAEVVSELASLLRGTETSAPATPATSAPTTSTPAPESAPALAAEDQNEVMAGTPAESTSSVALESPLETANAATATAVAEEQVEYEETYYEEQAFEETETPESTFLDKADSREVNLQALLGGQDQQQQVALFPHQQSVRAEHIVLALLVATLPAFVGLGLIQMANEPTYAQALEGYGRIVQEHLYQIRQWLGI